MGNVPGPVEGYWSTNGIVTNVSYSTPSGNNGVYTVSFNNPWGANYIGFTTPRSNRADFDSRDNDIAPPVLRVIN